MTESRLRVPLALSVVLAFLMAGQSLLGLVFSGQYRDVEWVRTTWFGNDWVTLCLAVPLLVGGLLLERRGSTRGRLLWLGGLGYGAYNYGFYLFGAALSAFFPLYVLAVVVSVVALILALSGIDAGEIAGSALPKTPVRVIGGYLVFVAAGLTMVWLAMWASYVFAGTPTPVEPEAFKLVAAMDLTVMVPALAAGGVLLWRRHPWGYVIAAIAGIQGGLYLLVLSVNSAISINRGLTEGPGELPVWGALAAGTLAASVALIANMSSNEAEAPSPDPQSLT